MDNRFNLAQGIEIEDVSSVYECYQSDGNNIMANISIEHYKNILLELCKNLTEPLFFFIEIPCDESKEESLRKTDSDPYHKDVYYLDNCNLKVILAIIKRYGDLLLGDGLVQFGFASHTSEDEIYVRKYKVLSIFAKQTSVYEKTLQSFNIDKRAEITTVWDVLSEDNEGECTLIELNGETVYDIVENLKDAGIYFSHTAEDE